MKPETPNEIGARLFRRWGAFARPDIDKEQAAKAIAISVGLGTIFNEDVKAERDWMQTPHRALRARPITALLAGAFDEVLDLVNKERNL